MLLGSDKAPSGYRLDSVLRGLNVDPTALVSLFERDGVPENEELALLKEVVRSPLTPDTLEGMWRCGVVFDVHVAQSSAGMEGERQFLAPVEENALAPSKPDAFRH